MANGRSPARNRLVRAAVGLLVGVPALWLFLIVTAAPAHLDPQEIPSVALLAPSTKWAGAVELGRRIVRVRMAEQNLPGLSVAAGIGDEIVWAEGFGYADFKTDEPVSPNHRFLIGTASTALASAAAGLLLEDGRLQLDDEIQKYVPAFGRKQWPVKLGALMGHTAGVVPDGGDSGPLFTKHCEQTAEALAHFAEKPLQFAPGTAYRYSNSGWILVSAAISSAAGQPFFPFMRERIFDPLGMRNTVSDSGAEEADDDHPLANLIRERIFDPRTRRGTMPAPANMRNDARVTYYVPRFFSNPKYGMHEMRPVDLSCYAGSSAFLSTPSDLVRFGMAIQSGKLLRPDTVQLLQTPQRLSSGKNTGAGLGWDIETVTLAGRPTRMAGRHGELLGGTVASLMTFPEKGLVVAVTSNIAHANTSAFALKIAEAFAEQSKVPTAQ